MSQSPHDAAETLSALDGLQLRTRAAAHRFAWTIWLLWALAYLGSVPVFLRAPDWAIGVYWLCVIPVVIAGTLVLARRLPRRDGVVPAERPSVLVAVAVTVVCFVTGAISSLGPALTIAGATVVLGWIWPRRLALAVAGLLASAAVAFVLLLDWREAAAAIMGFYAGVFVVYALYERSRLESLR